jgi:predicted ferric reductase
MKDLFKIAYIALPLAPWLAFMLSAMGDAAYWFADNYTAAYSASTLLGMAAFAWAAGQPLLAARPLGMDSWMGRASATGFHVLMGFLSPLAALAHMVLKLFYLGYPLEAQGWFGLGALIVMAWSGLGAWLLMAPGPAKRDGPVKALRERLKAKGMGYQRARAIHNAVALAYLGMTSHAALASSLDAAPAARWALLGWLALSLAVHVRYRIRGRRP